MARRRERHSIRPGGSGKSTERSVGTELLAVDGQSLLEDLTGDVDGVSLEVGAGATCSRNGVGDGVGRSLGGEDGGEWDA